ncbi:rhomboid family intramembrane serine protease [Mucilaginibacter sp.]|uniref:rhomboid family intramembrane serine protease n=1 Tax=Mucilaginibacter sp. TaxID=1882438 RepID=UPI0035BC5E19
MAFGFTPKHTAEYPLSDLTSQQFLAIASLVIRNLNWRLDYASANGLLAFTDRGLFKTNADIEIKITDNVAFVKSSSTGNEIFDLGRNKKFVAAFEAMFNELKLSLSADDLNTEYQQLQETFLPAEDDILLLPPLTATQKIKNFLGFFIPVKGFYVTPIILDINLLLFVLMVISGVNFIQPDNQSLISWGANFRPVTLNGQWWRVLFSCFLHIGIIHLLLNMYALLYIGILLEPYLGTKRFITAYLLTGIISGTTSLTWHDLTISAGASGAIFGMYGVFLAMLTTNVIEKSARKPLLISISIFVIFNLLNGLKSGIDNAAHIGGLISGVIIGYTFIPALRVPDDERSTDSENRSVLILLCIVLAGTCFTLQRIPNDLGLYDTAMKKFAANEVKALNILLDTARRRKIA